VGGGGSYGELIYDMVGCVCLPGVLSRKFWVNKIHFFIKTCDNSAVKKWLFPFQESPD
jgi:hypothetical protein